MCSVATTRTSVVAHPVHIRPVSSGISNNFFFIFCCSNVHNLAEERSDDSQNCVVGSIFIPIDQPGVVELPPHLPTSHMTRQDEHSSNNLSPFFPGVHSQHMPQCFLSLASHIGQRQSQTVTNVLTIERIARPKHTAKRCPVPRPLILARTAMPPKRENSMNPTMQTTTTL